LTLRWKSIKDDNLPFFVFEIDKSVAGYAYATKFRSRPAYLHTVEDSVYVADAYQNRGIGKALLFTIINKCQESGVRCIVAVLGTEQDNPASVTLHRKAGFQEVGTLHDVGNKNGKWIDRLLMEYIIM
jgi:L-amino acid N-acyltransferase YncA